MSNSVNAIGVVIPSSAGTNPAVLYGTDTGSVGYSAPSTANTVLSWSGSALTWIATTSTVPAVVNSAATGTLTLSGIPTRNFNTFAGSQTLTLPVSVSQYNSAWIYSGVGTTILEQNANQQITSIGNTTSTMGVTGSLTMEINTSYAELVCTTANNAFRVGGFTGTQTLV